MRLTGLHSKEIIKSTGAIDFSKATPCDFSRGYLKWNESRNNIALTFSNNLFYPSIKNPWDLPSASCIALCNKSKTSWFGTRSPRFIISANSLPLSVPDATSARNKSPVLKWLKPYFSTILAHCVPFPLPGPPKIQIIGAFSLLFACNWQENSWANNLFNVDLSLFWYYREIKSQNLPKSNIKFPKRQRCLCIWSNFCIKRCKRPFVLTC